MIKLLIVDDSALMRRQLTQTVRGAGDFEIRQARNGTEAVVENLVFQPTSSRLTSTCRKWTASPLCR
jgi:two-component system chemotaxis response regulator CheB